MDRWLHGSVAESVIHAAKIPVMLVTGPGASDIVKGFTSDTPVFVVPLDQSKLGEAVLPLATGLATALGGRIVLVSAVSFQAPLTVGYPETVVRYTDAEYAQLETDAHEYLDAISARMKDGGISVETVVRTGDAGVEIASVAEQYAAAAVIMATHGRTGVVRSMVGSVAGAVVHAGTTPVILMRPDHAQPAFATEKIRQTQSYAGC